MAKKMTKKTKTVLAKIGTPEFAAQVLMMLTTNWAAVHGGYRHIAPFTLPEVRDILSGKPGRLIINRTYSARDNYTRGQQFRQIISAIGANLVDQGLVDDFTRAVYHRCYKIKSIAKCPHCEKDFTFTLLVGHFNNGACNKPRCMLAAMREI